MQDGDSSFQNVKIFITGVCTKGAFIDISVSTGASFFISEDDYLKSSFKKGDPVSEEEISFLEKGHRFILCKKKALDLLAFSEHSSKMLSLKLKKRGFDRDSVSAVISDLKKKDYINDRRFAEMWINFRLKKNPAGRSVLAAELKSRGVPACIAEESVLKFVGDDELFDGASRIYKKISGRKNITEVKIKNTLLKRGYSLNIINRIFAENFTAEGELCGTLFLQEKDEQKK